jgi:hypothetical protein
MSRIIRLFLPIALLLITAHRLPAPIQEIPEPTPASKAKQPKSSTVKKTADMTSQELHVVFTDNTRAALMYLRNYVENFEKVPFAGKSDVNPNEITERLRQVLSNRFKNVSIASEGSSTRGVSGLIMVFDLQAHVGMMSFQKTTVSFLATFKDGGGKSIQTISAAGTGTIPWPASGSRFPEAVAAAFADFSQKLGSATPASARARR